MDSKAQQQWCTSGDEGFIIIAVLWILAALATLVSIYAIYVTNTAIAVTTSGEAVIADPLASAGVELAAYQLIGSKAESRPAVGNFTARIGAARLTVAFQTEAARIDLNAAPKPLLSGLFVGAGAQPLDADSYADRIIAWRSKIATQNATQVIDTDPENSLYGSAGLSYTPRHGPFPHVGELWLVYGIPRALIERVLPYVTVYSGKAQVDVLDAAPQVIAAVPGITPETLQAILAARAAGGLDRTTLTGLLGQSGASVAAVDPGKSFRVGVRIDFDNGRRSAAEAVILLPDDGPEPYRVLSWRNALDGTTDQPQDFGRR
jgi:general secretion pathway protein K